MQVEPAAKVDTDARLLGVHTPQPGLIRSALAETGGALPEVTIDVPSHGADGRALEYTYSISGRLWRPFVQGSPLVVRDRMLALQGHHNIRVRARVVGDYRTLDDGEVVIPVVIDSVPPRILSTASDNGTLTVRATDLVSDNVDIAFGRPSSAGPLTAWGNGRLSIERVRELAEGGSLAVWARDDLGNQTKKDVDVAGFTAATRSGCASGGSSGWAWLAVFGLVALVLRRRRSTNSMGPLAALAIIAAGSVVPGCTGCNASVECTIDIDCIDSCEDGQIGLCAPDGACLCTSDIQFGQTGEVLRPSGGSRRRRLGLRLQCGSR